MKIVFVSINKKIKYGGKVYEGMVKKVLSEKFEVENLHTGKFPYALWKLWQMSRKYGYDAVIKNFDSCLFLNKKPIKTIAVVHHIDYSFAPAFIKFASIFSTPFILRNLRKVSVIVVVSKYWQDYFLKRGYKNVFLVYNAFNLDEFNISENEAEEFKRKHQLTGKPIIYLGNCQKAKGVVESYEKLKDLDCYLVTSGEQQVKIPARNLEIEYGDYLKLLKASLIVLTMSEFKEGWCRTAHEAMLLKTPVIGSGGGGMRELLEEGKQIVCENFENLREKVEYLLNHPETREKMGQDGYNFAKNFGLEKFENGWMELMFRVFGNKKE